MPDSQMEHGPKPDHRVGRLAGQTRRVAVLSDATREAMWNLFAEHYADVTRERFMADLARKDRVILLIDRRNGALQGFSTVATYVTRVQGRAVAVFFSGDTILRPAYWGQPALQLAWLRNATALKIRHPLLPTYWFLISKGYKTYLLLTRNFPDHFPRHDRTTPLFEEAVINTLARERFGDAWLPNLGVLRFTTPMGRLRETVAPISEKLLQVPDIRFFQERNPGHAQGDELCCIGRFNLKMAWFYLKKRLRRRWKGR